MSRRRRFLDFPLVRIAVAAAPIVALTIAMAVVAPSLHLRSVIAQPLTGVGAVALYVLYVRRVERRRVAELAGVGMLTELARGLALGAGLFTATIAVLVLAGAATIGPGDGWIALAEMFALALGAALSEEILLRAIVFRIVEDSLGTWIALAVSALLFGALHAFNPGATLTSTVAIALEAGVLLAAAFVLTRRLWMSFGLHLAWNFTEGGVFGASVSGGSVRGLFTSRFHGAPLITGGAFGPEASIVAVALCLVAAIWLFMTARRQDRLVPPFWQRSAAQRT
jgi:membrane protease YdiL (CAAX protease family)